MTDHNEPFMPAWKIALTVGLFTWGFAFGWIARTLESCT